MGAVEDKVQELEEKVSERSFAYDLLSEFKALNKRMFIIIIILIVALVGSNLYWLYEWSSYDYTSTSEITVDGKEGNALYQDGKGNTMNYGDDTKNNDTEADKAGN